MSLWNKVLDKLKVKEPEPVKEPWFDVQSYKTEEDRITEVKADWNKEFIKFLKDNGYTGESEYDIVRKWFSDYLNHQKEQDENIRTKSEFE